VKHLFVGTCPIGSASAMRPGFGLVGHSQTLSPHGYLTMNEVQLALGQLMGSFHPHKQQMLAHGNLL
jgi:hypothetical protein